MEDHKNIKYKKKYNKYKNKYYKLTKNKIYGGTEWVTITTVISIILLLAGLGYYVFDKDDSISKKIKNWFDQSDTRMKKQIQNLKEKEKQEVIKTQTAKKKLKMAEEKEKQLTDLALQKKPELLVKEEEGKKDVKEDVKEDVKKDKQVEAKTGLTKHAVNIGVQNSLLFKKEYINEKGIDTYYDELKYLFDEYSNENNDITADIFEDIRNSRIYSDPITQKKQLHWDFNTRHFYWTPNNDQNDKTVLIKYYPRFGDPNDISVYELKNVGIFEEFNPDIKILLPEKKPESQPAATPAGSTDPAKSSDPPEDELKKTLTRKNITFKYSLNYVSKNMNKLYNEYKHRMDEGQPLEEFSLIKTLVGSDMYYEQQDPSDLFFHLESGGFQDFFTELFQYNANRIKKCEDPEFEISVEENNTIYNIPSDYLDLTGKDLTYKHYFEKYLKEPIKMNTTEEPLRKDEKKCTAKTWTETIKFTEVKDYFITYLVQYKYDRKRGHAVKINTYIPYPKEKESININGKSYSPIGVICHSGTSADGGHYFAYIRKKGNKWYKVDDSTVTQIKDPSKHDIIKDVTMIFWATQDKITNLNENVPIGISNSGLTCYFNALIQNLFNIPAFTDSLDSDSGVDKDLTYYDETSKMQILTDMGFKQDEFREFREFIKNPIEEIIEKIILKNSKKNDKIAEYYKILDKSLGSDEFRLNLALNLFNSGISLEEVEANNRGNVSRS